MTMLYFILLLLGAASLLVAVAGRTVHPRVNMLALGLFLWILVPLIQTFKLL